jgi:hypothetical protein
MNIEEIYKIVGNKKDLLNDLVDFLEVNYQPDVKFTFSKKSGWTIFFRKSGKPLCYMNLRESGFTVTVVIGVILSEKIRVAKISPETKRMFENAHQFHDGKWLNIDVRNKQNGEDIKTLLLIKKNPIKNILG